MDVLRPRMLELQTDERSEDHPAARPSEGTCLEGIPRKELAMAGDLATFQDYLPSEKLPGCCRVPRHLMEQVEANFTKPIEKQRSIASCARWLQAEGYAIGEMNLRNHVRTNHAGRFGE